MSCLKCIHARVAAPDTESKEYVGCSLIPDHLSNEFLLDKLNEINFSNNSIRKGMVFIHWKPGHMKPDGPSGGLLVTDAAITRVNDKCNKMECTDE